MWRVTHQANHQSPIGTSIAPMMAMCRRLFPVKLSARCPRSTNDVRTLLEGHDLSHSHPYFSSKVGLGLIEMIFQELYPNLYQERRDHPDLW